LARSHLEKELEEREVQQIDVISKNVVPITNTNYSLQLTPNEDNNYNDKEEKFVIQGHMNESPMGIFFLFIFFSLFMSIFSRAYANVLRLHLVHFLLPIFVFIPRSWQSGNWFSWRVSFCLDCDRRSKRRIPWTRKWICGQILGYLRSYNFSLGFDLDEKSFETGCWENRDL